MMRRFQRFIAATLIVCVAGVALPAQAGMLSTDAGMASVERERGSRFLARDEVRAQLQAKGVSLADAQARVAALSDDEVSQLAGQIDSLPAGGDILGVLLTVFIVLLITDILGFTKVFPFTRSIR
jgi:hypothetical protein